MTGHVPPPTTGTVGLVGTFHSLLDWGRYIVALVDLDPDNTATALVHFDHTNHRKAARRWQPGDRLIIHGTTTTVPEPGALTIAVLVRAHEVHKVRPDNIRAIGPQLTDHRRHTPPHILRRLARQQRLEKPTDEDSNP